MANPRHELQPTPRTQVHRLPQRASYDRSLIHTILDEGLVCHVGFVIDGQPYVIPTNYGRQDDHLYVHGSAASRMLQALGTGGPVCVTVTLVDGLVLARSAFHHSMNYRSVVILARAAEVEDEAERLEALRIIAERVVPGRWSDVRGPSAPELRATRVVRVPIDEASAKVRTGPPVDDEGDHAQPCWAGELPLRLTPQPLVPDPRLAPEIEPPPYLRNYRRPPDLRRA